MTKTRKRLTPFRGSVRPSMDERESRGSSPSRRWREQAVVSFTLIHPPKTMQANDLLSVEPADLIQAIIARRQSVASRLPDELERRQEENNRAYTLTKEAKAHLDALTEQGETTSDAQEALQKAKDVYEEHEQFRRRSSSRLQTVKNSISDCQEAIEFWSALAEGGWGHLLEDAERVASGGQSSFAQAKQRTKGGDLA
jgi:Skp family chaperone for outer membrane proteins